MQACPDLESGVLLSLVDIHQGYHRGETQLPVLRGLSLRLLRGETCAIRGPSGSGKSTLLNVLGLLDRPAKGTLHLAGRNIGQCSADELALIRNREIGFIFQAFHLLPRLSALENVALPLSYRGLPRREAQTLAMQQLQRVGLADRALHRPAELSGGQRQRVAIARALVGAPSLILADEPTGNLDQQSATDILQLLFELNREQGVTLVMVTHDDALATRFERQLYVDDGVLRETRRAP